MTVLTPTKTTPPTIEIHLGALEQLLRAHLDHTHQLLQCIMQKRDAIRLADMAQVTSLCADENKIIQQMATIEKHRMLLAQQITRLFDATLVNPMTVSEMAARAAEPQRSRMLALAAEIQDAVLEVRRESSIVRAAAEALSRHMSGIVQTVHSALSRARVYGNRGRINLGVALNSVVDIKS